MSIEHLRTLREPDPSVLDDAPAVELRRLLTVAAASEIMALPQSRLEPDVPYSTLS